MHSLNMHEQVEELTHIKSTLSITTTRFEIYYPNGLLREMKYYNQYGQLHGNVKYYHNNGNVAMECTYIDGKKQGMYFEYDLKGIVLFSAIFDIDIIISYIKF